MRHQSTTIIDLVQLVVGYAVLDNSVHPQFAAGVAVVRLKVDLVAHGCEFTWIPVATATADVGHLPGCLGRGVVRP